MWKRETQWKLHEKIQQRKQIEKKEIMIKENVREHKFYVGFSILHIVNPMIYICIP